MRSGTCAFVRLSENGNVDIHNSAALVKRALDIGADGVLIPCVETAEQCRILVSQARYPYYEPAGGIRGIRGIGGERSTVWGQNFTDHVQEAAVEPPFVVPLLETHNAFLNRDEIAQVVSVPPFTRAHWHAVCVTRTSLFPPWFRTVWTGASWAPLITPHQKALREWEGGDVGEETVAICSALAARGKRCGVMCRSEEDILDRTAQGFRVLTLGQDIVLMIRALVASLEKVRPAPKPSTSMLPKL